MHVNLRYHPEFNSTEVKDPHTFQTTQEQVILFKLVDAILDSQDEKSDEIVTQQLCQFMVQELVKLCSPSLKQPTNQERINLSSNDVETIFLLLQILANLTLYFQFHPVFVEEGLLKISLDLLAFAWNHERELSSQSENQLFSFTFKRELIRIIGNLSFRNRQVQDEVIIPSLFIGKS